jgi:hypothetical protein
MSGDLESVTIRVMIDLDDNLLDGDRWRLAAANDLNRDETGGRHFRQGAREVRLCPSAHFYELGNRLRLAIPNDGEKCRLSGVHSPTAASTELKLGLPASARAGRSPRATGFISSRNERTF